MKTMADLMAASDIFDLKLTMTTSLQGKYDKHPIWKMVGDLMLAKNRYNKPDTFKKVYGLLCNAAIVHGQDTFLLSFDLINELIKQDIYINRKELAGSEYNAFMAKAKADQFLIELEAPVPAKRLAGIYKIGVKEIIEFIETERVTSPIEIIEELVTTPEYESETEYKNEAEFEIKKEESLNSFKKALRAETKEKNNELIEIQPLVTNKIQETEAKETETTHSCYGNRDQIQTEYLEKIAKIDPMSKDILGQFKSISILFSIDPSLFHNVLDTALKAKFYARSSATMAFNGETCCRVREDFINAFNKTNQNKIDLDEMKKNRHPDWVPDIIDLDFLNLMKGEA